MTHIVQATGTGDPAEANRLKFGMIHKLQGEFSGKVRESRGTLPKLPRR